MKASVLECKIGDRLFHNFVFHLEPKKFIEGRLLFPFQKRRSKVGDKFDLVIFLISLGRLKDEFRDDLTFDSFLHSFKSIFEAKNGSLLLLFFDIGGRLHFFLLFLGLRCPIRSHW